ncbi:methyl-accepting chemotaxis protein [Geminocystis sp. GBBB08]|uniref:methyl-accepting chemotaxis protein n=1 Tax=Geminocystis sp. GBBB08 TaxID=2604140 RepID=UPI0027E38551|nr:methyl-accepting chemotaxis protein [Geminocystis sp. GBBB08]MBL1208822.1 HAMP domain-containing protein [Geminocystis sp. GBBB08]
MNTSEKQLLSATKSETQETIVSDSSSTKSSVDHRPKSVRDNTIKYNFQASRSPKKRTLRNQLLITVLPSVLIPLVVASGFAINFTYRQARERAVEKILQTLTITSEATQNWIDEVFEVSSLLHSSPFVLDAVYSGQKKAQLEDLEQKPFNQLENIYNQSQKRLLEPDKVAQLNNYLKVIVQEQQLKDILITEKHGYNVAYSTITPYFVQSAKPWWHFGKDKKIVEAELDESSKTATFEFLKSINESDLGGFLGVTRIRTSTETLNHQVFRYLASNLSGSQVVQIISTQSGKAISQFTPEKVESLPEIIGGKPLQKAVDIFAKTLLHSPQNLLSNVNKLKNSQEISKVNLIKVDGKESILSLEIGDRIFYVKKIPGTGLMASSSIKKSEIATAGRDLTNTLILITFVLGIISIVVVTSLARELSKPLTNLTTKAQQVAQGDLDVKVVLEETGTLETFTLGNSFNNLVKEVKNLIAEQTNVAQEREKEKEKLEKEIYQLLDEVSGALEGDLTVRANLDSIEMSTVADLFNAIIDSLKDIAIQVKQSTTQVGSSLIENQLSIQELAGQAIKEAEATNKTLESVQEMSESIEIVAQNANQAAILANDAFQETQEGTQVMDDTVNSIVSLRTTVGETAKKIKRLGESSQKISQVVSLIEEIALKTNLLAINASVEASRAGEQGQGFTVVAEQVGALAEQSAIATQEIAQIVANIQLETQEVTEAMEVGTTQVVDSTRLVEATKKRLEAVLEKSQRINELMQSISQTTVTQTDTSSLVKELMQQIASYSQERLKSSEEVSQSMRNTAQIAQELQTAVEQFNVE